MMWLGIVLHVSITYMTSNQPMPWYDHQNSQLADFLVAFIHVFRMPVFLILAGFFLSMLVERRGVVASSKHRIQRLLLPFICFWPPIFVVSIFFGLLFLHLMRSNTWGIDFTLLTSEPVSHAPNTMHMWFLWQLIWISMISLFAFHLYAADIKLQVKKIIFLVKNPLGFIFLASILTVAGIRYGNGLIHASGSFFPPAYEWLQSSLFFILGLIIYFNKGELFQYYASRWKGFSFIGILLFFISILILDQVDENQRGNLEIGIKVIFSLAYNMSSMFFSFALIGLFLKKISQKNIFLSYLSDSSYWVFLVHMPLTIFFAALMYNSDMAIPFKILINIVATTFICVASYHLCVRETVVGVFLNGRKRSSAE